MTTWTFAGSCADGEVFELVPGHNIWGSKWTMALLDPVPAPTGDTYKDAFAKYETAQVVDPQYGRERRFSVYEIVVSGRTVRFAAGEFSNGIWGFYLPEPSET